MDLFELLFRRETIFIPYSFARSSVGGSRRLTSTVFPLPTQGEARIPVQQAPEYFAVHCVWYLDGLRGKVKPNSLGGLRDLFR